MRDQSIEVDEEALEILNRRKRPDQSYSDVIKESLGPSPTVTGQDLLDLSRRLQFSEETLDRIEEQVRNRSKFPIRIPEW